MGYIGRIMATIPFLIISVGFTVHYHRLNGPDDTVVNIAVGFVSIVIAWFFGKQYDKVKLLNKQLHTNKEELLNSKQELQQYKDELECLFKNNGSVLWSLDFETVKTIVSDSIQDLCGYSRSEFDNNNEFWMEKVYSDDREKVESFFNVLVTGVSERAEWRVMSKDGSIKWVETFANPIFNSTGEVVKITALTHEITARKEMEAKLEYLAFHDNLTGLPNRSMINASLKTALERCKQHNQQLALLFLDLDRFKLINDTLGHDFGDTLLKQVSDRLVQSVRAGDIVARHGGDEFIVLVEGAPKSEVIHIANRILHDFTAPFLLEDIEFSTSPSIGISMYPENGQDIFTLTKHADQAMYQAKKRGKNNYQFYIQEDELVLNRRNKIEYDLKKVLNNQELQLHYQPKVVLETGEIYGVEALLRWNHPELGNIPPAEFIPIAEELGMIIPIGQWVIEEACKQAKRWQDNEIWIKTTVNVSTLQFEDPCFVEKVRNALNTSQLLPKYLGIEITESVMQNIALSSQIIGQLQDVGVICSIDDFGTGYSSLSVLNSLPIENVKIDKSFISEIGTNPNTAALVRTMIQMAKNLNFDLIAEGIETEQQVKFLIENGCIYGQGYYFSRPLPADEVPVTRNLSKIQ